MIYENWMEYIKDEVKLCQAVIPSAHNAGSYGMKKIGKCQNHGFYKQFQYGIRHFCVRLDTDKKGNIVLCHGITKGDLFENALKDWQKMIESSNEFFIFDVREYYPQKVIGKWTLRYHADPKKVDELLEKYIMPSKYAYTDCQDISALTMGDIRKSGKRFILLNYREEYGGSVNCEHIIPWDKTIYGSKAEEFSKRALEIFDMFQTNGLYWFQTQQTPNIGTKIGFRFPEYLDKRLRPIYYKIIEGIANNSEYLSKANIISGDFMTEDYLKVRPILILNVLKNNVTEGREAEYVKGLWSGSYES